MYNQINSIMSESVKKGTSVFSSCIVMQKGKQIYSNGVGTASERNGTLMTADTICRLFSLTKPITAAAAMIATDKGLFDPDTRLSRFFPEFSYITYSKDSKELTAEAADVPITIGHLLNMTAGLPYPSDWGESVRASGDVYNGLLSARQNGMPWDTKTFAGKCADIPLYNIPGDYWFYGVEADILGAVIEKASGMRYSEFLQKYIFAPLEMNDTAFFVPQEKKSRLADLYQWSDKGLIPAECRHLGIEDFSAPPLFESGGAGLFSTINDYSKFADMLCHRGCYRNSRIISEKAFDYMTTPKFNEHLLRSMWDRLSGYNYSCFMRVMTDVSRSRIKSAKGEFGWDGWTGTYFCAHPESGITVLYFTQICGASTTDQAVDIVNTVFGELS